MASLTQRVLHSYKRLLRARFVAFPSDPVALHASRVELKQNYLLNRGVTGKGEIEELLEGVDEVEGMLRNGIAQGVRNERGNYEVKGECCVWGWGGWGEVDEEGNTK